jgi:SAM-dependent methyltransferase
VQGLIFLSLISDRAKAGFQRSVSMLHKAPARYAQFERTSKNLYSQLMVRKIIQHIDDYNGRYSLICTIIFGILSLILAPNVVVYINETKQSKSPKDDKIPIWNYFTATDILLFVLIITSSLLAVILFFRYSRRNSLIKSIFERGQPFYKRTHEMVSEYLLNHEISLPIKYNDVTTVDDLIDAAKKVYYPNRNHDEIEKEILKGRRKAYEKKYSDENKNDEKIRGIPIYGFWDNHLLKVLDLLDIYGFQNLRVLDVGIGNANTYDNIAHLFTEIIGVDLSEEALKKAKQKIPSLKTKVGDAENLPIPSNSVDLYISLRTFQSTLFNRRHALHEAKRVLSPGGKIIISIPTLYYLPRKKKFIKGLCNSAEIYSMRYANNVADGIKKYLEMLNFHGINIYEASPYELFVYGHVEN